MRKSVAGMAGLAWFLIALPTTHAQSQPTQQVAPYAPSGGAIPYRSSDPERTYARGRHMRTLGMILTAIGVGLCGAGVALLANADSFNQSLGLALTFVGVSSAIPGGIVWHVGVSRMDEALQMGATGSTPRVHVVAMTWRF